MDESREQRVVRNESVDIGTGESEILRVIPGQVKSSYVGNHYKYIDQMIVGSVTSLEGEEMYEDRTRPFLVGKITEIRAFLDAVDMHAAMHNVPEPETWGMYVLCRSRAREHNDIVHILNDRYDLGVDLIEFDMYDGIEDLWAGALQFQSGENDMDDGALWNHKKISKNKYAHKQYRRKVAIRAEHDKVISLVHDFQDQKRERAQKRELLAKAEVRYKSKHYAKLTDVHHELKKITLYIEEIKALKKQEARAKSCLNKGRLGRAKEAYTEEQLEAQMKKRQAMDRVNAQRALQYLEFVEKFKYIDLDESRLFEEPLASTNDDVIPSLRVNTDLGDFKEESKTRTLSLDDFEFQAGNSRCAWKPRLVASCVGSFIMGFNLSAWNIFSAHYAQKGFRFNLDRCIENFCRRTGILPPPSENDPMGSTVDIPQDTSTKMIMHAVEKAVLFIRSFLLAETFEQQSLIFLTFISCHMKNGITSAIMDVVKKILSDLNIEFQSGTFENIKEKWNMVRDSKAASKTLSLISFVVATIMSTVFGYDASKFNYTKYLSLSRPKSEGTILECIVDDCIFFLEKGLLFIKTGSFKALFVDDLVAKKYDEEFAFLSGNFQNVEIDMMQESCGISLNTYLSRLEQCVEDTKSMSNVISKHSERRFLTDRLVKLTRMLDTTRKMVQGRSSRMKPYGVMIDGRSGVGKTTFKSMLIRHIMLCNPAHFSGDKKSICTMNGDDPYQTELTNGNQVLVLDDLGQTNPLFAKSNPCQLIINVLNNEPKAVLKADVDSKGKVYYSCNLVVVTTNVEHLHSATYSVEPAAVIRRLETIIRVSVKEQYRVEGGVSIDKRKVNSLFTDLWEFYVYYKVPTSDKQGVDRIVEFNGEKLEKCSFETLCNYLKADTARHFSSQSHLLKEQEEVSKMGLCEHGLLDKMCEQCPRLVPESGALETLKLAYEAYEDQHMIGEIVRKNGIMCSVCMLLCWVIFVANVPGYYLTFAALNITIAGYFVMKTFHDWRSTRCERGFSMQKFCKKYERASIWGGVAIVSVPLIYYALKSIRDMGRVNKYVTQGADLTVPFHKETKVESCWTVPIPKKNNIDERLATMTVEQGLGLVRKKIAYAEFDTNQFSDIFPVLSNVWIINYHTILKKPTRVRVYVQGDEAVGPNFECSIGEINYRRIGDTDFALLYLPKGGSQMNMLHMFPREEECRSMRARLVHKKKDGKLFEESIFAEAGIMNVAMTDEYSVKGFGYTYRLQAETFKGLCMSVLVSEGLHPELLGFHFAGSVKDKHVGTAQRLTQKQISCCLVDLYKGWDNPVAETTSATIPKLNFPEQGVFQNGKIHPKSPVLYLQEGDLRVYGDHTGHLTSYKSKIKNTKIADTVAEVCGEPIKFGAPKNIGSYKPKIVELEKITNTKELPWDALEYAMKDFHGSVRMKLEGKDYLKRQICKISNDVNLAGLDGIRGIDGVNLASSMGHPINKPKSFFVTEKVEPVMGISRPLEIDQKFWNEVDEMEQTLLRGERIYPIAKAHLKDEPKKLNSEKVRVFYGTQFVFLLLLRRYCLTLCKFYMDHPSIFETTVGMNVFGPEWNDLAHKLTRESFDRLVAGDFQSYDSFMSAQVILASGKGFIMLAVWSGMYDDEDIKILIGIFTELANPMMDYFGTYIEVFGCNTSGHSMTIILNDWAQKLYERVAFFIIMKKNDLSAYDYVFNKAVFLRTNGDDNVMSVRKGFDLYNHTAMQEAFASFGIGYTMPNKTDVSKPFCRLEEVDYLKRRFRWDVGQQRYHPALERDSIFKMLQVYEPSKVMSDDELCANNINTALQEMYYHGTEAFFTLREQLEIVVDRHDLRPWFPGYQLRSYDECLRFDLDQYNRGTQLPVLFIDSVEFQNGNLDAVKIQNCAVECSINKNQYSSIGYQDITSLLTCYGLGLLELESSPRGTPLFRGVFSHKMSIYHIARNPVNDDEIIWIPNFTNNTEGFDNVTNNVSVASEIDRHQTVSFRDGAAQWISAIGNYFDNTRDVGMTDDVPLSAFFERPIKIATFQWDPAVLTKFYQTFNPWRLYFENSRIVNRINNYQLMRAKLKVKFVINGNSFYYGLLLADYAVRPAEDDVNIYGTGSTLNTLMSATQRLHIYLDPTESQGGIMCLPFISELNNMNIPSGTWSTQGDIHVRQMSALKHANGSVNPITISVYAWAEDVKLSIPTTQAAFGLVAQSGEFEFQSGEYGSSPVSNIMSSVAEIAGKLVSVPSIAPFAKATQLIANGVGSTAKLFGFSRPLQIENNMIIKRTLLGPMTNCDRGDTATKLSVDSKQEVSIDPRIVGVSPTDELSIAYLASKESWFAQFPWTTIDAPNKLLFTCWVTPKVINRVGDFHYTTSSAFACIPFRYWRGSIIYRFRIVASAYHRGRLLFVYAPNQQIGVGDTCVQYSKIVDLANERDFTMEIGWGNARGFLEVGSIGQFAQIWSTTAIGSSGVHMNGTLSVYTLNDLTTPSDSVNNDITVNVFMRCCDDFSVAVPTESIRTVTYLNDVAPQSGDLEFQSGEMEQESSPETNAPLKEDIQECAAPCLVMDNTYDVYFGEKITSMRTMLKRYMYFSSQVFGAFSGGAATLEDFDFPVYRGVDTQGRHQTNTTAKANIVNTTLLNYLAPAFVGYRGSIRYKVVAACPDNHSGGRLGISRTNKAADYSLVLSGIRQNNNNQFASDSISFRPTYFEGGEVTDLAVSPVLEVELPYYSNQRFTFTRRLKSFANTAYSRLGHVIDISAPTTTGFTTIDKYVSVGEDFNLFLYQGQPPFRWNVAIVPQV